MNKLLNIGVSKSINLVKLYSTTGIHLLGGMGLMFYGAGHINHHQQRPLKSRSLWTSPTIKAVENVPGKFKMCCFWNQFYAVESFMCMSNNNECLMQHIYVYWRPIYYSGSDVFMYSNFQFIFAQRCSPPLIIREEKRVVVVVALQSCTL